MIQSGLYHLLSRNGCQVGEAVVFSNGMVSVVIGTSVHTFCSVERLLSEPFDWEREAWPDRPWRLGSRVEPDPVPLRLPAGHGGPATDKKPTSGSPTPATPESGP